MSVTISHHLEVRTQPIGWEHSRRCDLASKGELLWYFFPGDIEIVVDGTEFKTQFGSVPALHFVSALVEVAEALEADKDEEAIYSFTEVDERIRFRKIGSSIVVDCSFDPRSATASFAEFSVAACEFAHREIQELGEVYPSLLMNSVVRDLLLKCERNAI